MNLHSIWQHIKSFSLVAVITMVIWLLAEGRTVQQQEISLSVKLLAPPGQDLLIEPDVVSSVLVATRSANAQLALLSDMTRRGPLTVVVNDDKSEVFQTLDLAELLRNQNQLREIGVEVTSVTPAEREVRIEEMQEVAMEVEVVAGEHELAAPPTVDPAQIIVRAPASVAAQLQGRKLQAKLARLPAQDLTTDVDRTVDLPLDLPPDLASMQLFERAPRARVTFRVRSLTRRATLERVPILMVVPPSQLSGVKIELEDEQRVLRDVVISGPTRLVEQIEAGQSDVWAYFRLTAAELSPPENQQTWTTSAPLTVNVPSGVRVESPPPVASVRLSREPSPGAATTAPTP